jgi:DNA-binding NtrC family response regulator
VVFGDIGFRDGNWRDLVDQVRARHDQVPIILCAQAGTAELWWDALECEVQEIALPPYSPRRLASVLFDVGEV